MPSSMGGRSLFRGPRTKDATPQAQRSKRNFRYVWETLRLAPAVRRLWVAPKLKMNIMILVLAVLGRFPAELGPGTWVKRDTWCRTQLLKPILKPFRDGAPGPDRKLKFKMAA